MRIAALALVVAAALALAGCAPAAHPTATPKPSATPVFASDDAALEAAEVAYAGYESAVDRALATGDGSRLDKFATGAALTEAKSSLEKFKAAGQHQTGSSAVYSVRSEDLSGLLGAVPRSGEIYACLDVSGVDVVDASGASVSSPDRDAVFPMTVTVVWSKSALRVSEESVWDGANYCG